jgi:hypothetical protein
VEPTLDEPTCSESQEHLSIFVLVKNYWGRDIANVLAPTSSLVVVPACFNATAVSGARNTINSCYTAMELESFRAVCV